MFPTIASKKSHESLSRKVEPAHRHEQKSQASISQPSLPSPSQKSPRKHVINVQSSQQSQTSISTDPTNSHLPSTEDRALVVPGKEPINSYLQGTDDKMAPAKCRPCPDCKRKFNEASYKKHVKVCQKVFSERRKKFDSRKHRIEGTQMATLTPSTAPNGSTSTKSASDEPKWKVASEAFRQAIKQAKVLFAISLKKSKQSGTFACEPPIRSHWLGAAKGPINSYLQGADDKMAPAKCRPCPDCKRKFNEASYKKHVKVCKKVFSERRKKFDSRKHRKTESASDEPKWKVASEAFRQAIKQAKLLFMIARKKSKQSGTLVSKPNSNSDEHPIRPHWLGAAKEPINSYLQGTDDKMAPAKCRPCPNCKRKFNKASYKKHVKVCKKVFSERRKKFDSRKHRMGEATESASDEPKWKVASEAFRQAIKQAKVLFAISLKKTKKTDNPSL